MSKFRSGFDKFDLTGKTALISGGAGLLGKEHAKAILSANGNVVLWDLNETALSRAVLELRSYFSESKIQSFVIDITKEDENPSTETSSFAFDIQDYQIKNIRSLGH